MIRPPRDDGQRQTGCIYVVYVGHDRIEQCGCPCEHDQNYCAAHLKQVYAATDVYGRIIDG